MNRQRLVCTLAMIVTLALAGCGGGGGVSPLPTLSDAWIVPHDALEVAASQTANSTPRFTDRGVLRSSNTDSSGRATDTVSIMFNRPFPLELDDSNRIEANVTLTTTSQDGSNEALDSATHSVPSMVEKRALPPSPIRRHFLSDWTLFDYQDTATSAAYVSVSWHRDDPTDYLAGGYWIHLKGDLATDSITDADIGAFIDGSEFSSAPVMPPVGTATYRGRAAGLYTYYYGPMWEPVDPRLEAGDKATGEYSGVMTLTADFGADTISGCIGCDENFETTEVFVNTDGTRSEIYTALSLASIKFGSSPIKSDGTFTGEDVEIIIGGRAVPISIPVSDVQGSWGGRFSNRPAFDGSGDPRLVAGTTGAQFSHPDGSHGEFIGNFFAPKVISQ